MEFVEKNFEVVSDWPSVWRALVYVNGNLFEPIVSSNCRGEGRFALTDYAM